MKTTQHKKLTIQRTDCIHLKTSMKPINRLKKKEEGRRKEKALINEQVKQSWKRRQNGLLSWMGVRGCRVGTEVDKEQGGRVMRNSRALCSYTRHWETHSNTFTHSHTDTVVHTSACFCPLPHRLALASRRAAPSPVPSPVLGVEADRPSPQLTPQLHSSASLWTELNAQGCRSHLEASTIDLREKKTCRRHQPQDHIQGGSES